MTDNHTDLIAHLLDPIGDNHCVDCCCARSWTALGVSEYDGKSIPEHITILRERIAALKAKRDALWLVVADVVEMADCVLLDPDGRASIHGSDADLALIQSAIDAARAAIKEGKL